MGMKKQIVFRLCAAVFGVVLVAIIIYYAFRTDYPRPYREIVEGSGQEPCLVYALIKTESGFDEEAVSAAGAVGLMQLLPSTAEFICARENIEFQAKKLKDGAYNVTLGCKYLAYLRGKFSDRDTALAAYNAGEGTVAKWLADPECSADGVTLTAVPYAETRDYLKKIAKFEKIYEFYYG